MDIVVNLKDKSKTCFEELKNNPVEDLTREETIEEVKNTLNFWKEHIGDKEKVKKLIIDDFINRLNATNSHLILHIRLKIANDNLIEPKDVDEELFNSSVINQKSTLINNYYSSKVPYFKEIGFASFTHTYSLANQLIEKYNPNDENSEKEYFDIVHSTYIIFLVALLSIENFEKYKSYVENNNQSYEEEYTYEYSDDEYSYEYEDDNEYEYTDDEDYEYEEDEEVEQETEQETKKEAEKDDIYSEQDLSNASIDIDSIDISNLQL